jgi:hypothetical protein
MRSLPNPLNLRDFDGRLLMRLGQCATCGELDSAQRGALFRAYFPDPPRAIYGILYVDFTDAGFVRSDSTVPSLVWPQAISPFLLQWPAPR